METCVSVEEFVARISKEKEACFLISFEPGRAAELKEIQEVMPRDLFEIINSYLPNAAISVKKRCCSSNFRDEYSDGYVLMFEILNSDNSGEIIFNESHNSYNGLDESWTWYIDSPQNESYYFRDQNVVKGNLQTFTLPTEVVNWFGIHWHGFLVLTKLLSKVNMRSSLKTSL
jgi:hypothetical protein